MYSSRTTAGTSGGALIKLEVITVAPLEVITVAPKEQRVLMLFDQDGRSPDDEQIREYLQQHDLAPRKQYEETRDATRYDVYYFGHCYLEGHLESLTRMASGPSS